MKVRVMTTCTMFRTYECEVPDSIPKEEIEAAAAVAPKVHLDQLDDVSDDEETVSIVRVTEDGRKETIWEEGMEYAEV